MKIGAAAIQMCSEPGAVADNLERADSLLDSARRDGAELAVLPEMFNTGYGARPDYAPIAESIDGPTIAHLRGRAIEWDLMIAAGFVEREGHHLYDSLAFCQPDGSVAVYRKRNLVFWERFRFRPGRSPLVVSTRFGRIGFAICADMIYRRVWDDYRDRVDLALVSAAWPEFACRNSGRQHRIFGIVGPKSAEIPPLVAADLGVPVIFANQCGLTRTTIPMLKLGGPDRISDRFAGQSSVSDGRHGMSSRAGIEEQVVLAPITLHSAKGPTSCHFTSRSARAASSSASAR